MHVDLCETRARALYLVISAVALSQFKRCLLGKMVQAINISKRSKQESPGGQRAGIYGYGRPKDLRSFKRWHFPNQILDKPKDLNSLKG